MRGLEAVRRVPPLAWLAAIVLGSFAALAAGAAAMAQPVVFADELHYSGAAERLAEGHAPVAGYGYGLFYPLLLAPLYALLPGTAEAYEAVKTLNAALFSLAAVPAYLLARRAVRPGRALVAALLTVLLPTRVYAYLVLTESVAFVLFLCAALLIVRAMERPTAARQLAAVALCLVAVEARRQLVVLVAAMPLAVLIACWSERGSLGAAIRPAWRRFRPTWLAYAGLAAVAVGVGLARSSSASGLGSYDALVRSYDPVDIATWLRYHLAIMGVVVVVIPLAAYPFGLRECLRRGAAPGRRGVGALGVALLAVTLVQVAAFSSTPFGLERMHERYLFYVFPLVFCVFAVWLEAGLPRPRPAAIAWAGAIVVLPLLLPANGPTNTVTDGPTLFALGLDADATPGTFTVAGLELRAFHVAALATSVLLLLWFLLLHRRFAGLLVAAVVVVMVMVGMRAHTSITDFARDLETAATTGTKGAPTDWVDVAAQGDEVASLALAPSAQCATRAIDRARTQVRHTRVEFFSTRIARVLDDGDTVDTALPTSTVRITSSGAVLRDGAPVRVGLVLLDARLRPDGAPVAASPDDGLAVWRVDGRLRLPAGADRVRAALCGDG